MKETYQTKKRWRKCKKYARRYKNTKENPYDMSGAGKQKKMEEHLWKTIESYETLFGCEQFHKRNQICDYNSCQNH